MRRINKPSNDIHLNRRKWKGKKPIRGEFLNGVLVIRLKTLERRSLFFGVVIQAHERKRLRSPDLMEKYPRRHIRPKRASASDPR
jgi:hypothetical protein